MNADPEVGHEEPKKRGAKSQYAEEMFERVRARVAEGMPVPTAIQAAGMCVSQFYAAVAEHQEWMVALQKARLERRVERLEDESCRRIFIGDSRLIFWKGEQVGEIREPAIGMLIFMMKTLSPERYANTKAAAKRRAQLDGLEASRARVLANAQRGVTIMQGHYRDYLRRCGVPVPPGDSEQSSVNSEQLSVNSEQLSVNSEQLSVNSEQLSGKDPETAGSNQSSVTVRSGDDAAGQKGNLTLDHDLVPSGSKAPPCTHGASGAEDTESTAAPRSPAPSGTTPCTHGVPHVGRGDTETVSSDQSAVNSDQSSVTDRGEDAETGQWADAFDPDYHSEPKLPPPYEPWWRPGMDVTVTMLEDEAYRLAIEGVVKPIFQQGTEVGERRVRSERLLKFLLITSAFKKFGRREVRPLEAEEEPGRPEFMAKLNKIYSQDEELHRKFTEVFERNNARRHAERLADLERKNRPGPGVAAPRSPACGTPPGSKAPPCTHSASGAEDAETGRSGDTETGQRGSGQPSATARRKEDAAGQKGNLTLDHDLDHNHDLVPSGKAPPCTHSASGAEDTEMGRRGDAETRRLGAVISRRQAMSGKFWILINSVPRWLRPGGKTRRRGDTESKTPPCTPGGTPECLESGGQSHAQMVGNETIAKQENPVARRRDSGQKAVGKAPPCTHGATGAEREDTGSHGDAETSRSPAGTAENPGAEPEHDAAWYSPSARAARITQSMIEHRLRKRRIEM